MIVDIRIVDIVLTLYIIILLLVFLLGHRVIGFSLTDGVCMLLRPGFVVKLHPRAEHFEPPGLLSCYRLLWGSGVLESDEFPTPASGV